ncbi:MAG: cyanophycinase [Myxococcota bacterium]|nr:cyanophycinase [Myxococcota bacterium]
MKAAKIHIFGLLALFGCSEHSIQSPSTTDSGIRSGSDTGQIFFDAGRSSEDSGFHDADAGLATAPATLVHYVTGSKIDAFVSPSGPALVLMGGSREVDAAFEWWAPRINGGDVVILRTSGSDGYNNYLYSEIGGPDSVETMLVTSRALADHAYVAPQIRNAEGIFLAGGDQSTYLSNWKHTEVENALHYAWQRGAVIGGTSAGLAVLGEFVFAAHNGSIDSDTAMTEPFHPRMSLENDFLELSYLENILTDSHFGQRSRLGRLVAFMARCHTDLTESMSTGLGIDERTALIIDNQGQGTVMGSGHVYVVKSLSPPEVCESGKTLTHTSLEYWKLTEGDAIQFPGATVSEPSKPLSVTYGKLNL